MGEVDAKGLAPVPHFGWVSAAKDNALQEIGYALPRFFGVAKLFHLHGVELATVAEALNPHHFPFGNVQGIGEANPRWSQKIWGATHPIGPFQGFQGKGNVP